MGFISTSFSAIGKLLLLGVLLAVFLSGMAGVVYMSLSGNEIKVPEIVGKDFVESEKELAALGLKIKRRADRPSAEKINTVLEQLPRAGETVKTGQLILVVVSKSGEVSPETPKTLIEDVDADDTKKIEEMITDKPKKAKSNANSNVNANSAKKVADTTRDTISNVTTGSEPEAGKTDSAGENANKKDPNSEKSDRKVDSGSTPSVKPQASPNQTKTITKPPTGEQRPRTTKPR
jgi:beta-lactam-binding protein with PASTA domain